MATNGHLAVDVFCDLTNSLRDALDGHAISDRQEFDDLGQRFVGMTFDSGMVDGHKQRTFDDHLCTVMKA